MPPEEQQGFDVLVFPNEDIRADMALPKRRTWLPVQERTKQLVSIRVQASEDAQQDVCAQLFIRMHGGGIFGGNRLASLNGDLSPVVCLC